MRLGGVTSVGVSVENPACSADVSGGWQDSVAMALFDAAPTWLMYSNSFVYVQLRPGSHQNMMIVFTLLPYATCTALYSAVASFVLRDWRRARFTCSGDILIKQLALYTRIDVQCQWSSPVH